MTDLTLSGWRLDDVRVLPDGGLLESWTWHERTHQEYTPGTWCGPGDRLPPRPKGPVDEEEEDGDD